MQFKGLPLQHQVKADFVARITPIIIKSQHQDVNDLVALFGVTSQIEPSPQLADYIAKTISEKTVETPLILKLLNHIKVATKGSRTYGTLCKVAVA